MTELKLLSTGLIAAAMLATPIMARIHQLYARLVLKDASASPTARRALVITRWTTSTSDKLAGNFGTSIGDFAES
jgi:hypothetical protein